MKHTPGPWYAGKTECLRVFHGEGVARVEICECFDDLPEFGSGVADAMLIAAAPALKADGNALAEEIEAIASGEFGVDWADHYGSLYKLLEQFKATARKAEGAE